jgi:hypothetical protein
VRVARQGRGPGQMRNQDTGTSGTNVPDVPECPATERRPKRDKRDRDIGYVPSRPARRPGGRWKAEAEKRRQSVTDRGSKTTVGASSAPAAGSCRRFSDNGAQRNGKTSSFQERCTDSCRAPEASSQKAQGRAYVGPSDETRRRRAAATLPRRAVSAAGSRYGHSFAATSPGTSRRTLF